jgi:hypothetical protein
MLKKLCGRLMIWGKIEKVDFKVKNNPENAIRIEFPMMIRN